MTLTFGSNPAPAIRTEANPLRDRRGLLRFGVVVA